MMKAFLLLVLTVTATLQSLAQQKFVVRGTLHDHDKQPIHSGEVSLFLNESAQPSFIAQIVKGGFILKDVPAGIYILKITSAGFDELEELVHINANTSLALTLNFNAANLDEVTVSARKNPFSFKNGNISANMNSPLFSTVTDPVVLLSKIPGVQLSNNNETINVAGKGQPLVYINNLRSTLQDVKSLAVADIASIELINDPSSKYEADGRVLLLIKTKNSGKEGVKGEIAQTAAIRKYYLNRFAANASYRKKKMELKGNVQFNHLETWEGNAFDFALPSRNIRSGYTVTAVTTRSPQMIAGAGIYYQLNELDYISANSSFRDVVEKFPIYTESYLEQQGNSEKVLTENYNRSPERYRNANLNFNKGFKKSNANFFAGFQYTQLGENVKSSVFNAVNNNQSQLSQLQTRNSSIRVKTGRIDFEKTFKKGVRLETGSSVSFATSNGLSSIQSLNPGSTLNTIYNYKELNGAAYTQLNGKNKQVSWSAGLRMETTQVKGNYEENSSKSGINKHNTNVFPKASFTVALDSLTSVGLRYSKNINRQNYSNANQTVVYINPYFEWANNINLNPSIFQEVVATFQYRNYKLEASLFLHQGAVNSNFTFDEQRGVLRRTELNYERESGVFIGATIPFKYRLWSSTNVINLIHQNIFDPLAVTGKARPFVYVNSSNEFSLPGNYVVTTSAWAVTKSNQGVFERNALFAVDTSLSKKFNRLTCSFRIDDVFGSINPREAFTINNVVAAGKFYDNVREYSLSLKYSFGRLKETSFRNRDVDENSNRVR